MLHTLIFFFNFFLINLIFPSLCSIPFIMWVLFVFHNVFMLNDKDIVNYFIFSVHVGCRVFHFLPSSFTLSFLSLIFQLFPPSRPKTLLSVISFSKKITTRPVIICSFLILHIMFSDVCRVYFFSPRTNLRCQSITHSRVFFFFNLLSRVA